MKSILVTGGAGYIGSTLVPMLLNSGYRVRVLDSLLFGGKPLLGVWPHPNFEFVHADMRDAKAVESALKNIDGVVHLAAIVGDPACAKSPDLARSVNLESSSRILEESRKNGVSHFIFASTCSNYGKMTDEKGFVDETSELRPVSLYAETKVEIEKRIIEASAAEGFPGVCLRFSTVYGISPRMRFDLTVNEFVLEMRTKKHLVVFGEQFWRPYMHVRDAARSIAMALETPHDRLRHCVFNVGRSDQNYQKKTLTEMMKKYIPDAVIERVEKKEDPRDYKVSFDRIRECLNFDLEHTVDDGIREILSLIDNEIITDFSDPSYRNS